jgi:hypothetical protein
MLSAGNAIGITKNAFSGIFRFKFNLVKTNFCPYFSSIINKVKIDIFNAANIVIYCSGVL